MTRRALCIMMAVLALTGGLGCMEQPFLTDVLGFLPGPSPSLVQQAALTDQLLGMGGDPNILLGLAGSGDQTGTDTTSSGTGGGEDCPEGQVWVGTVTVGGVTITINQCVSEDQAAQYGL